MIHHIHPSIIPDEKVSFSHPSRLNDKARSNADWFSSVLNRDCIVSKNEGLVAQSREAQEVLSVSYRDNSTNVVENLYLDKVVFNG